MAPRTGEWSRLLDRRSFIAFLVLLTGVRFVASTMSAFAGIQGMDTRSLDTGFEAYSAVLLVLLASVVGVEVASSGPETWKEPRSIVFLLLTAAVVVEWLGVVDSGIRLLSGSLAPWTDFLLGLTGALAVAVFGWVLVRRVAKQGAPRRAIVGLRRLAFGFATALLLRSIRLLDFAYLFGWSPPSGLLWALDFGPSLLLSALAILAWAQLGLARTTEMRGRLLLLGVPIVTATLALGAALGILGGFILANALAWGGSYTVFSPTTISLPIVGFAIGGYLSLAWSLGRTIPGSAAWPLLGGIAIAALAGIQTSAGTLASFVGVLAGVAVAARGVTDLVAPPLGTDARLSSNIV